MRGANIGADEIFISSPSEAKKINAIKKPNPLDLIQRDAKYRAIKQNEALIVSGIIFRE